MAATFASKGYGQVEANRLSALVTGDLEAQAPAFEDAAGTTPIMELENGMFLCVLPDTTGTYESGRISVLPGAAPANATPKLVYSEKKLYDERDSYSDFVAKADDHVDGTVYPRLCGMIPEQDVFTTNTINATAGTLAVGDLLYVGDDGYLSTAQGTNGTYEFVVVKVYTMPDGQEGVKVMPRVKA